MYAVVLRTFPENGVRAWVGLAPVTIPSGSDAILTDEIFHHSLPRNGLAEFRQLLGFVDAGRSSRRTSGHRL